VAEFPLREGLRALLMLALHRTGRQAQALTAFQDARRYLTDEFGVEALFAGLAPIVLCSAGSWIYFAVTAVRRRDLRQVFVSAGYLCSFIALFATVGESDEDSPAAILGVLGLLVLALIASLHGVVLASHPGNSPRRQALRAHARWIAASDPARARELGIGRPDRPHEFDDGGLVDVNHVSGYELSRLRGLDSATAYRIVMDRHQHGPFLGIEDLLIRGLITPGQLHRLGARLVCVPHGLNSAVDYPPK
jgi:SARP family transcriptional regulator, regulator of embCAB operon